MSIAQEGGPPKVALIYDPKVRSIAYQVVLVAIIVFLAYSAVRNAADNLARAKIASGFGFWNQTAGFDISQTLIEYTAQGGTYGRAFWVGLLNTLLVAAIGIVLATIVGFLVGIARLSKNFLLAKLSTTSRKTCGMPSLSSGSDPMPCATRKLWTMVRAERSIT